MLIFTYISQSRLNLPGMKTQFALGLHSGWTKAKNNMTKLLVLSYKGIGPVRNLTLQSCSNGTCEALSHFECFPLPLLELWTASVRAPTCTWFQLGVGGEQLEKRKEEKEVGWEFWERMGKCEQEPPRQIICQHKVLPWYQQMICCRSFLSLLPTTSSLKFSVFSCGDF